MDNSYKVKKEILEEIMSLMDEQEGQVLKKHPKIAKVDIKSNDPELAEDLKDKLVPDSEDVDMEEESSLPIEKDEDELDEETKQKLIEMYKSLK